MTPIPGAASTPVAPVQAQPATPAAPIPSTTTTAQPVPPAPSTTVAPVQMTAAEYQAKYGTPPPAPVTMTAAQYQAKYGVAPTAPNQPSFISKIINAITSPFTGYGAEVGQSLALQSGDAANAENSRLNLITQIGQIKQEIAQGQAQGKDVSKLQATLAAVAPIIATTLQQQVAPASQDSYEKAIGNALGVGSFAIPAIGAEEAGTALAGGKVGQAIVRGAVAGSEYGALGSAGGAMSDNESAGGVAGSAALGGLLGGATGGILGGTGAILSKALTKALATDGSVAPEVLNAAENPRNIIGDQFRNTIEQYTKPGQILDKAEAMGSDPIGVLQSYGNEIIPELEDGKITAKSLDEPIAVLENGIDTLSKYKADSVFLSDNNVPLSEFRQQALDYASRGGSVNKVGPVQADINHIFDEMEAHYKTSPIMKEGAIPLSEVDRIKSEQADLSKNFKPNVKTFNPDSHYYVSKAARNLVETMSDDPTLHKFNQLIESHYDAIKLLNSLVGKTPHGGKFNKIIDMLAGTMVGGMAGSAVGHPLIGAIIGRGGAHAIDALLHNNFIPNPLKRIMVANILKDADPKVVTEMMKWIDGNSPDISELGEKAP